MKRLAGCIVALLVSGPLVAQDYVLAPALQYSTGPNQKAPVESIVSGRGVRFDVAKAIGGQQPGTARYERPVMSGTVDPLGTLYGKFTSSTYKKLVNADPGVFSDSTVTSSRRLRMRLRHGRSPSICGTMACTNKSWSCSATASSTRRWTSAIGMVSATFGTSCGRSRSSPSS